MTLETSLLVALYSLVAVAFIGVLNARGPWRTGVAAVLALGCLVAALWQTTAYRAARAVQASGLAVSGTGDFSGGTSESPGAGPGDAGFGGASGEGGGTGLGEAAADEAGETGELAALAAATRALRDSLGAEDPSRARALNDSAYQAFEARAEAYLSSARLLRERAARLAGSLAAPGAGETAVSGPREEAAEALNAALQSLAAAARDLRAFFRASGRDEEQRLAASFRRGVDAAAAPLRRAEGAAAQAAP